MNSTVFPYAPALHRNDNENHPPGVEPLWQESSLVCFCDPDAGLAGFHRIGIHPNKREASVYSWTQVGNRLVSRAKRTALRIPGGSTTGTSLEGVTFTTLDPLMRYRFDVDRDGVKTSVEFASFVGPVTLSLNIGKATVAPNHYNMLGRVTGSVTANGTEQLFDGVGFLDHSWGPRDANTILGHRWIMSVFDAQNFVCSIPTYGPKGSGVVGYLMLDGRLTMVTETRATFMIGSDNQQIEGCRATITDSEGRSLELEGKTVGEYGVQPYGQGYFATHAPAVFESGGRRGRGFLEWSSLRFMPPWHREALGMSPDDPWLVAGQGPR